MREEELGTYQMLWDCPACGTEKLLGLDHRYCPGCGAAQDPSRRYFPPEGQGIAVKDHVYTGADKKCSACESPNAAKASHCTSCGSGLEGGRTVKQRGDQVALEGGGGFAADSEKAAAREHKAAGAAARAPKEESTPRGKGKLFVILGLVAAVLVALVVLFTWSKPVEVEAKGHHWSRTIEIEQMRAVSGSDWKDEIPAGAYGLVCTQEVRSHKKVQDGETCLMRRKDMGDGTFKEVRECEPKYREEPVRAEKCRYDVDRWTKARTAEAKGGLEDPPRWPEAQLAREGSCLGCERQGERREVYEIELVDAESRAKHTCAFPEGRWTKIAAGTVLRGKSAVIGDRLDCDGLVAK